MLESLGSIAGMSASLGEEIYLAQWGVPVQSLDARR